MGFELPTLCRDIYSRKRVYSHGCMRTWTPPIERNLAKILVLRNSAAAAAAASRSLVLSSTSALFTLKQKQQSQHSSGGNNGKDFFFIFLAGLTRFMRGLGLAREETMSCQKNIAF